MICFPRILFVQPSYASHIVVFIALDIPSTHHLQYCAVSVMSLCKALLRGIQLYDQTIWFAAFLSNIVELECKKYSTKVVYGTCPTAQWRVFKCDYTNQKNLEATETWFLRWMWWIYWTAWVTNNNCIKEVNKSQTLYVTMFHL